MVGGAVRWALVTAVVSVTLAAAIGFAALCSNEDEQAESAPGSIEGNYAFASTNLLPSVATLTGRVGQPFEVQIAGGRLAIGADGHMFWSLQITWPFDATRSGRLSCEGSYDRATGMITPSPRFGFTDFPPVVDGREVVGIFYNLFCAGDGRPGAEPIAVAVDATGLHLRGPAGSLTWRRQ